MVNEDALEIITQSLKEIAESLKNIEKHLAAIN